MVWISNENEPHGDSRLPPSSQTNNLPAHIDIPGAKGTAPGSTCDLGLD